MGSHKKHRKQSTPRRAVLLSSSLIVIIGMIVSYMLLRRADTKLSAPYVGVMQQNIPEPKAKRGAVRMFSGAEFRDLYNSFAYPNTEQINEETPITGDPKADQRIRGLAERRGYRTRSAPVSDSFIEVEAGMKLQQRAVEPWKKMKESAKKDGIDLYLTAAYRSANEQNTLLMDKLRGIRISEIESGAYDSVLDNVLRTTAVPGFSRHHTGYTIDIGCGNDRATLFDYTVCFQWLSKDNYKNAKLHGWIPSYPEGAGQQGPDPETWEYVWVGTEPLTD